MKNQEKMMWFGSSDVDVSQLGRMIYWLRMEVYPQDRGHITLSSQKHLLEQINKHLCAKGIEVELIEVKRAGQKHEKVALSSKRISGKSMGLLDKQRQSKAQEELKELIELFGWPQSELGFHCT